MYLLLFQPTRLYRKKSINSIITIHVEKKRGRLTVTPVEVDNSHCIQALEAIVKFNSSYIPFSNTVLYS